jgi:hypothetical protein
MRYNYRCALDLDGGEQTAAEKIFPGVYFVDALYNIREV